MFAPWTSLDTIGKWRSVSFQLGQSRPARAALVLSGDHLQTASPEGHFSDVGEHQGSSSMDSMASMGNSIEISHREIENPGSPQSG